MRQPTRYARGALANAKRPFLDTGVEAFLTFKFHYDNGSGTIEIENPGS